MSTDLPIEGNKHISIQAIDRNAVHRICSGQVVLNLATAVKELVENSLDAGATTIEIRLKEYGSECIEVIDNGYGVEDKHFQGLTLKHHTSKLREFSDLMAVETFGFRGEALSSLCALSELSVVTRHTSAPCGTRLDYDSKGHIVSQKPCARQVGTTVCLQNLFSTLPVRLKEFHRNLRREFGKMVQILNAYCLVSTNVKIVCTNQVKKGARSTVVSTQGGHSVRENIGCVFGAKQVQTILEVSNECPSTELLQELGISETVASEENPFKLDGYVSSCAHGQGRSASDRQFYYVNSRPCEPHKVIKVVNEVYHHFNKNQYPFVYLNLKVTQDNVDVNLTPDKRQVYMGNEKLLMATVKASLLSLYESVPSTFKLQNLSTSPISVPSSPSLSPSSSNLSVVLKQWSHSSATGASSPTSRLPSCTGRDRGIKRSLQVIRQGNSREPKQFCVNNFFSLKVNDSQKENNLERQDTNNVDASNSHDDVMEEAVEKNITIETNANIVESNNKVSPAKLLHNHCNGDERGIHEMKTSVNNCDSIYSECGVIVEETNREQNDSALCNIRTEEHISEIQDRRLLVNDSINGDLGSDSEEMEVECGNMSCSNSERFSLSLNVSVDSLKQEREHRRRLATHGVSHANNKDQLLIKFLAKIHPSKNTTAEQELRREISKDMFAKMEILGQFNLGFIITRLDSDLFIIDQHATDEIYNFEMLQKTTTIQNQQLVIPQQLELTFVNESILIENQEIFHKNGFDFIIDESAEPTKKIKLTAIPLSKNWTFGKDDIDELLFMLQDAPHTMCRPSRVRAMFASRACRKSVMIGTALSNSDMRRLVNHMGEINQPWNCPHGRPTMRHLVNMDVVYDRWAERLQE